MTLSREMSPRVPTDMEPIRNASIASLLGLVVSALPLLVAILYAARPSERRLALLRPLTLAAIFAGVADVLLAIANGLHAISMPQYDNARVVLGIAEGLIPAFLAFVLLAAAWLTVTIGVSRQP